MKPVVTRTKHGLFSYFPNDKFCGRSLELYGEWSDAEVGLIEQLVSKGGTVLEVGAHFGAHTVAIAQHVGREGRVIAYEPQAPIFSLLRTNLQKNGGDFVECHLAAVGARCGKVQLPRVDYDAEEGNFGGVSPLDAGVGGPMVDLVTIDSLKLRALDLIKVDVEGMEADVLRGAVKTIRSLRPILYLENDRVEKSPELIELVRSLGYRMWWHLPPLYDKRNFRKNGVNAFAGYVSVNMLCIPAEEAHLVRLPLLREVLDPAADWNQASKPRSVERRAPAEGQKTVAVLVPHAYGDALFASSVFHHLHLQGYHVTAYCDAHGEEILRHDPNVDRILWISEGEILLGEIQDYYLEQRKDYSRAINLWEVVVRNMIAWGPDVRFLWPDAVLRQVFRGNYLELLHGVAEVPMGAAQRFYPTYDELQWVGCMRAISRHPIAVLSGAGSTVPKFWPYLDQLADALIAIGFEVWILGDLKGQEFAPRAQLHVIGTDWTMRQACAWTQRADVVIGQETGLLNAVALEPMTKVVLLSHSTQENLTKHWVNARALNGAVPCWPCHRLHASFDTCTREEKTGAAACQAAISVDDVIGAIPLSLKARAAEAALKAA